LFFSTEFAIFTDMQVFKYSTYRVLLTHADVEERGLDIPEDLFDEIQNAYVLPYYAAHKYKVLTDRELAVIDKCINTGNRLDEISFSVLHPANEEEIKLLAQECASKLNVNRYGGIDTSAIEYAIINYYKKCNRPFDDNMIRKVVREMYVKRLDTY
jgi:hypothetical protein